VQKVYLGDCLKVMDSLEPEKYDLIIASPPFGGANMPGKWTFDFDLFGTKCSKLLKKGGVLLFCIQDAIIGGHKQLVSCYVPYSYCTSESTDLFLWCDYIFVRGGCEGYWWAKRPRIDHDMVYVMVKGRKLNKPNHYNSEHMKILGKNGKPKCKGTVLDYVKCKKDLDRSRYRTGKTDFPVAAPIEFIQDFIKLFTNPNEHILDPFCGTGTTLKAAKLLNRNAEGIEILPHVFEYCKQTLNGTLL
jgi:site-specific DNA-methyltransferase (adenine-specific)